MAEQQASLQPVPVSNYTPLSGSSFYLLSDSSYGSDEEARVRIEANAREQYYLEQYGGADIRLYRIPDPLSFLQQQKNLHRVLVKAEYRGEGAANTLSYLWDSWYKSSRRSWQRVFSAEGRQKVTAHVPELATSQYIPEPTRYEAPTPYAPLKSLPLITQFRYPIWQAKGITPPNGVRLEGSSSDFIASRPGNVMVPLGKQAPGLYLVEAIIGGHRATTLVFVSNSVLISKIAGQQLLAWSVDRHSGKPATGTDVIWTDGLGTLKRQITDRQGLALLNHSSPEHSYLLALDKQGGLTIAENFYYDSEIYNTKLYTVTDRPLYRPGDKVQMKFLARHFTDARTSTLVNANELTVSVIDPSGLPLLEQHRPWQASSGADASVILPDNAIPGGYEIRATLNGDSYSAAFRVAEYIKPHFDIEMQLDKPNFKTGEPVTGKIRLHYPDGAPVANADISASLKGQQLSMVEDELRFSAQFPVKLQQQELKSDAQGEASFTLPPASEPSRYVLTLLANDDAAWRVKRTLEILIERGMTPYRIEAPRQFSQPGDTITFSWHTANGQNTNPAEAPARYQWLRLEDRKLLEGALAAGSNSLDLPLSDPGSYRLTLRDSAGNLIAATSHWVAGPGLQTAPGVIEIHPDQSRYDAGKTATLLLSFPAATDEALVTLERDGIEHHALLSEGADWVQARKLNATQWELKIPIQAEYAPNMTLSVLNVQNGDYQFRNVGLLVRQPQVTIGISSDKSSYLPGENVKLTLNTHVNGQPKSSHVVVSVVDEMVYLLQPELAPDIHQFFYHPRRNNVRTTSSLNFITYDMSIPHLGNGITPANQRHERGVKVLERPRRDDQDTALWRPDVTTDADGKAEVSFVMPDALTRWRVVVRAYTDDGIVGQQQQTVLSDKPFYLKWSGPTHFRQGDQPTLEWIAFNRGDKEQPATIQWPSLQQDSSIAMAPGPNWLRQSVHLDQAQPLPVQLQAATQTDALETTISLEPVDWRSQHQQRLEKIQPGNNLTLSLPADADKIELYADDSHAAALRNLMDSLIDYPYGCLEQTASRLLPLAIAYRLQTDPQLAEPLRQTLLTQRLRLVHMANPDGSFGWWGDQTQGTLLLSSYAYYVDWFTMQSLGLPLPEGQGDALLALYQQNGQNEPLLHRLLALGWMQQMGLPIQNLLQGADDALLAQWGQPPETNDRTIVTPGASLIMLSPDSHDGLVLATLLSQRLHHQLHSEPAAALQQRLQTLQDVAKTADSALIQWLIRPSDSAADQQIISAARAMPTLDRAVLLDWIRQSSLATTNDHMTPEGDWRAQTSISGATVWHWQGKVPPQSLRITGDTGSEHTLTLQYRSRTTTADTLPVSIKRTLYELVPLENNAGYQAKPVTSLTALQTNRLYVDEVKLQPQAGQRYRYGLLEVPLPPGGSIEPSTWGIAIAGLDGNDTPVDFTRSQFEEGVLSYQVPVPELSGELVQRQLLRLGSRGKFTLPAARLFLMYQPDQQAQEADVQTAQWHID